MLNLRRSFTLTYAVALVVAVAAFVLTACGPVNVDLRGHGGDGARVVETTTYVVKEGDTLSGIASAYGTSVEELITLNAEKYPKLAESKGRVIVPGWELTVPRRSSGQATANGGAVQDTSAPASTPQANAPQVDANGGYFDYDAALEIVRLTNEERARYGLPPLNVDEGLMDIARKRSVEIVANFSHDGKSQYCNCGENIIARRYRFSAQGLMNGWIESQSHRENMLRDVYQNIGVGVYRLQTTDAVYAVQIFTR